MSETRSALIIANYQYDHEGLRQLVAPAQDAESLGRVLADPAIGGFEVRTVVNEPSYKVNIEIESFCDNRKRDDLLLIYFSGHGIRDVTDGQLYFATIDTQLVQQNVRRSTAVAAHFVNELMSNSRSRRQILLLDCCYSGAFKEGMLAKGGNRAGAPEQFDGVGRIVLTASDALQYSFEGPRVQGEGVQSVFTRALVEGLESGNADLDRDGWYSLDEVYDYVYARVTEQQPGQKPMKMGYVEGKILIGNNPRPSAALLPPELRESIEDRRPWVRLGAVHELRNLLASGNKGLMLAAQAALTALEAGDDSQEVRKAARQYFAAAAAKTGIQADAAALARAERERLSAEEAARQSAARVEAERAAAEAEKQKVARAEAERAEQARQRAQAEEQQRAARAEAERLARPAGDYVRPMRRAAADLVDWLITLGIIMSIGQLNQPELVGSLALGAAFIYSISIRATGATPGHKLMGTRIVDFRGNPLSYPRSVAYVILWLMCSPTLILGTALSVRFSERHIAVYDALAGTKAVAKKA